MEVLTTQELLGCSRSIGPIRPCGRNPEIGRVTGNFFCPGFPSALRAPGKPGQLRGGDHQALTQVQELWTSPSGQPAPCGTCGQAVDEAGASPTALTTLACFSPTGTTGQPQHRFFQYSDSSGLTAGEKGDPTAPGPRKRTTVIACTAVLKSGWGSLAPAAGWPSASLPASKRRTEPRLQSGRDLRANARTGPSDVVGTCTEAPVVLFPPSRTLLPMSDDNRPPGKGGSILNANPGSVLNWT